MWKYVVFGELVWGAFLLVVAGVVRVAGGKRKRTRSYAGAVAMAGVAALVLGSLSWPLKSWTLSAWHAAPPGGGVSLESLVGYVLGLVTLACVVTPIWLGFKALFTGSVETHDEKEKRLWLEQQEANRLLRQQQETDRASKAARCPKVIVDDNMQAVIAATAETIMPNYVGNRPVGASLWPEPTPSDPSRVVVKIGDQSVGQLDTPHAAEYCEPLRQRAEPFALTVHLSYYRIGGWSVHILEPLPPPDEIGRPSDAGQAPEVTTSG